MPANLTFYRLKGEMPKRKPVLEGLINTHSVTEESCTVNELNMLYNQAIDEIQQKLGIKYSRVQTPEARQARFTKAVGKI